MSDTLTTIATDAPLSRDARIRAVVLEVVRRRIAGGALADEAVIAQFAELMPELGQRLAALRRVEAGRDRQAGEPGAAEALATLRPGDDGTCTLTASHVETASSQAPPPADLVAGYAITREISRGGQGVVYEALQAGTKRRVAIKILHPVFSESSSARRRFEREVELVAGLRHPHIVSIFHIARTSDGRDGYVMDFVAGATLKAYARQQRLSLRDALRLFAAICDAVQFAHQNGVVHRDLKPSNILIDAVGEPRLLDFGLARPIQPNGPNLVTASNEIVGTLPYMSPEQTRGGAEALDTRSDVYSLGVILYELLTGRFPYAVDRPLLDALRSIAESPPTPLPQAWIADAGVAPRSRAKTARAAQAAPQSRSAPSATGAARTPRVSSASAICPIDDEVETIVLKALSKERERRYQSAGELGRDVRHYLAGEAIEAKRDSLAYQLRKLMRRHRTATIVATAVLALVAASVAISFELLLEKRAENRELVKKNEIVRREAEDLRRFAEQSQRWLLCCFLLEWNSGRAETARDIHAQLFGDERFVADFLMRKEATEEELAARLAGHPDAEALAALARGERAARAGDLETARGAFEQGAAKATDRWWKLLLAARARSAAAGPAADEASP